MRYHYMDFARSVFMTLGVVLHTSAVFSPQTWRVQSVETSQVFEIIRLGIHTFRMQSFYLIAGFFAFMVLEKYDLFGYLKDRIIRLCVPMLFCGFTINYIMNYYSIERNFNVDTFFTLDYLLSGTWMGHLWFLGNLIVYIFLLLILSKYLFKIDISSDYLYLLSIFLVPLFVFLSLRIGWRISPILGRDIFVFFSFNQFMYYFVYFFLGAFIYKNEGLLNSSKRFLPLNIIVIFSFVFSHYFNFSFNEYFMEIFKYLFTLNLVYLLIALFFLLFNFENNIIRSFSDSSYTIYLLHQPIIVVLSFYLVKTSMNIYFLFFIISLSSFVVPFLVHKYFIKKNRVLRFLLNGNYK